MHKENKKNTNLKLAKNEIREQLKSRVRKFNCFKVPYESL